ncbi:MULTISPECIES: retron St85 family RNA-directed DNA polymerase [unclassified Brevundimonas]|uniref:retron St85 family RNA-directed DNA polymerase n=1 Tax=unclassified Brevundimonas TaxID=2622653 RepID=UPI0030DD5661
MTVESDLVLGLSRISGLSPYDVRSISLRAPRMYKTFKVFKADGVSVREIAQPAREVKLLQRAFNELVLSTLPIHKCATAYRTGMSLRDNVTPHAENGPILKMDFRNFFPSIKGPDWTSYCRNSGVLVSEDDINLSEQLLFRRVAKGRPLSLAIGAPSSPALSNILLHQFDELIFERVGEMYVTYTRYADDLTFSAPRTGFLQGVQSVVAKTIRDIRYPSLAIHGDKTRFVTTKFGRHVTGLTISLDGRVTAGQYRKRQVRAGVNRFAKGELDVDAAIRLAGLIAFVDGVEKGFIEKLKQRYGDDLISRLCSSAIQRKGFGRINPLPDDDL